MQRVLEGIWPVSLAPEWAEPLASSTRLEPEFDTLKGLDDRALVASCVAGRKEAFDILVERHQRSVYLLCYRFVGKHEDAADLAQDVFVRAYRAVGSFRGNSSLATWLYRIAVNVCLNRVARRTPATSPLDDVLQLSAPVEDPALELIRSDRAARVRAAIARLPEKQRATLILRAYHELSHREIAQVMGSTVGAVKANFFHALGNLKKILGNAP